MKNKVDSKIMGIRYLTPLQEGMLFHKLIDEESTNYCNQILYEIEGSLDEDNFCEAWNLVSLKHEILRTVFVQQGVERPRQVVLAERNPKIIIKDLKSMADLDAEIDKFRAEDIENGFHLTKDVLFRVHLFLVDDHKYKMLWSFHHIIMDGWSISILLKDFSDFYQALTQGKSKEQIKRLIESDRITHLDFGGYVDWLEEKDQQESLLYWEKLLDGYDENSVIPHLSESVQTDLQVKDAGVELNTDLTGKLVKLAKEIGVTISVIIETAFGILIQKYNRSSDAVFGKIVSGRNADEYNFDETVGLFINCVPVRVTSSDTMTITELLTSIQQQSLESAHHDHCSLPEIQSKTRVGNDLIKVVYTFENYYVTEEEEKVCDLNIELTEAREQTNYDISLMAYLEETLTLKMFYDVQKYSETDINRILSHLTHILTYFAEKPSDLINQVREISAEERQQILTDFNCTETAYPDDHTFIEIFEAAANNYWDRTALILCREKVSYKQLNEKANQLAWSLSEMGIGMGDFVAVLAGRGIEAIVAFLGILKTGAAYVPMDVNFPASRLEFMIEDCCPKAILTAGNDLSLAIDIPVIDLLADQKILQCQITNLNKPIAKNHLAYLIYTSGTTGKPKGVMIEHGNLVAFSSFLQRCYELTCEDIALQFANMVFDASIYEISMALYNGGALCLLPDEYRMDTGKCREYMAENHVSVAIFPPQYYQQCQPKGLRILITGGAAADPQIVKSSVGNGRYVNAYGPTESTVQATFWEYQRNTEVPSKIPIGKPIDNTKIYIMNSGELCGIGIPGEICIAGAGVARGYLNRDELTAQKFSDDPFGSGKIYYSGDLGRWNHDGNIEFLGRIDEQVKIRGYRIELGEIETILRQQEGIRDCTVIVPESQEQEKSICAYYVSDQELDVKSLKAGMKQMLPDYMLPAYYMQITEIPVNQSGKVDKKALPKIQQKAVRSGAEPTTETQKKLVEIFANILAVEDIGIGDDFFENGGHSLKAIRLVNQIESQLQHKITLKQIFDNPTIEQLSKQIDGSSQKDYQPIEKAGKKEYYLMSPAQKRMFLVNDMDDTKVAYNVPASLKLRGSLDLEKIHNVLNLMISRHEILRTAFKIVDGELVQYILDQTEVMAAVEYQQADICDLDQLYQEFIKPFSLEKPPLFRVKVIAVDHDNCYLLMDFHHIITDAGSMSIFIEEFSRLYQGEILSDHSLQYKDYSEWINGRDFTDQKDYWLNQFADGVERLDLPLDYQRPKIQSFRGKTLQIIMDSQDTLRLLQVSEQTGTTEYMILLSAFMILLSKYSRQEDIIVGTPVSGRAHQDTEDMMGIFINTLALRGNPQKASSFKNFLNEIKDTCLTAFENQEFPFEDLAAELNNSIFDVFFTMQGSDLNEFMENNSDDQADPDLDYKIAKFDLTLNAVRDGNEYYFMFEYCIDLFEEWNIQTMMEHYVQILKAVINNPDVVIGEINGISDLEINQITNLFNTPQIVEPEPVLIQHLFQEQAEKNPDRIAIKYKDQTITYHQLDIKTNQLANYLLAKGIKPGDRVAIFTSRSIEMVIGKYGVLKAGAAYIPVDPGYPQNRIDFIIKDCDAKCILLDGCSLAGEGYDQLIISLDNPEIYRSAETNPGVMVNPGQTAYVIYTSGTTGHPKGVMVDHRGVGNLRQHFYDVYHITENDVVLKFANAVFDASVWEINMALLTGASLMIATEEMIQDEAKMKRQLEQNGVTVAALPPNYLARLDPSVVSSLRVLVTAGSATDRRIVETYSKDVQYINEYGPTEVTVTASYWKCEDEIPNRIPIGKPIINKQIYILDQMQLCGIGVPGEICIAGMGIAQGYLNQPQLSADKFIKNPFGPGVLYRSGDLGRWLPDGNIDFLGRIDQQVKIRGYRVELLEVENVLRQQPLIKEAAVIVRKDKDDENCLCGFVTGDQPLQLDEIKNGMKELLPDYMIPLYMMQIDQIPVNKNGKVDRHALPEIEVKSTRDYVKAQTETQKVLISIFESVLGIEPVGIYDNFFDLGGHSLRAAKVQNQIEEHLGVRISLRDMFSYPTPAEMEQLIGGRTVNTFHALPKAAKQSSYPVSAAQKQMFMLYQMDPQSVAYNMPDGLVFNNGVDQERLTKAYQQLVDRHEILRTVFCMENGEPVQKISTDVKAEICLINGEGRNKEYWQQQFIRPFALETAPLMRLGIVKLTDTSDLLLMDLHHIIADGMTVNLFWDELTRLYNGETLNPQEYQYKDYSQWMQGRNISNQKEYWITLFKDQIPVLDLPLDYQRPKLQSFQGRSMQKFTALSLMKQTQNFASTSGLTEYMVLLGTLMILLGKYSRQEDIIIGSPVSGRVHKDTETIAGLFLNTLAMRGKPEQDKKCDEFLGEVKELCLKAFENQEYPFEELVANIFNDRDMSRNPLFDVMFVMQNNEETDTGFDNIDQENISISENHTVSKFDLTVNIAVTEQGYLINFEYCSDLFRPGSVRWMMEHFLNLLEEITTCADQQIKDLKVVGKQEQEKLLIEFNDTEVRYPSESTMTMLFEQQVKLQADKTALIYQNQTMSYQELNEKANRLAYRLRLCGVGREDYVALLAERGIEVFVGILAILKAGGAFLPIDPDYPMERIKYMLTDSGAKVVLTGKAFSGSLDNILAIKLDDQSSYAGDGENLPEVSGPHDLAYLIYTSGTTGRPKGVMVEHYGVANLREYFRQKQKISEADRVLQFASISFDASISEMAMSIFNGGTLCIVPEDIRRDVEKFEQFVSEYKITIAVLPPQFAQQASLKGLRRIITAGSEASRDLLEKYGEQGYSNDYGPTEATVCATHWGSADGVKDHGRIPIGKPICNKKIYILQQNQLCGIGIPGELCIAGDGLARGYLNNQDMTNEKFGKNLFGTGKLYRSGDLARWLEDGNIEFLGRVDDQVKIRGYRIELGEVEAVLSQIEGILDVAVIARKDNNGDLGLHAYFTANSEQKIEKLREYMLLKLPDYMIPAYYMQLEAIPRNQSQKVNKKMLPEISLQRKKEYIEPANESERQLAVIFGDVLGLEKVGTSDNFFEMGGDSIKAIRIVSKMRELGLNLNVRDIMSGRTIQMIAVRIRQEAMIEYSQEEYQGEVELLPIQREFLYQWELKKPEHFNQAMMVKTSKIDQSILATALRALVIHHDMLRSISIDGTLQVMGSEQGTFYDLETIDISQISPDKKKDYVWQECTRIQSGINLSTGPLMKVLLITDQQQEHLMLCIHHLVVDGVSWGILLEDLETAYKQLQSGQDILLPSKTASYPLWSKALWEYEVQGFLDAEKDYWKQVVQGIKWANLKEVSAGPAIFMTEEFSIDKEVTDQVIHGGSDLYRIEINDILLTALSTSIYGLTGQKEIAVMLEGHGREEIHKEIDISRTVGWFTISYPVLLHCGDQMENNIIQNKEILRKVPKKGIGYGILINGNEQMEITDVDLTFNYLGQMDSPAKDQTALFCSSELPVGVSIAPENQMPGNFMINGYLSEDCISFQIQYNSGRYSKKYVNDFIEGYQKAIKEIVTFIAQQKTPVQTLSDIDAADISDGALDAINDLADLLF